MLARAAVNIYVSELDAEVYLRMFPNRQTAVVPNGVDTDYFSPMRSPPERGYVVFEGNMNFEPNVDTAEILVRDILPLILERVPEARVGLVGRNPTEAISALASANVEVTGTVPGYSTLSRARSGLRMPHAAGVRH